MPNGNQMPGTPIGSSSSPPKKARVVNAQGDDGVNPHRPAQGDARADDDEQRDRSEAAGGCHARRVSRGGDDLGGREREGRRIDDDAIDARTSDSTPAPRRPPSAST